MKIVVTVSSQSNHESLESQPFADAKALSGKRGENELTAAVISNFDFESNNTQSYRVTTGVKKLFGSVLTHMIYVLAIK